MTLKMIDYFYKPNKKTSLRVLKGCEATLSKIATSLMRFAMTIKNHSNQVKVIQDFKTLFIFLLVFAFGIQVMHAQDFQEGETVNLRLAVPYRIFDDLTRKDAQLAMDMWTKEMAQQIKETTDIYFNVSSTFLENEYEIVDFTEHKEYDILLINALDFLEYHLDSFWNPIVIDGGAGRFPEEYLILSRKDRKYKDIAGLRGKRVVFSKYQDARVILFWLGHLFRTQNLGTVDQFFSSRETVQKDSKAVLSVFFNKADACIVGYNQFQTMVELNPQIGRDLGIIAESPGFVRGMFCLKKTMKKQFQQILTDAVFELPNSQRGKQILKFFGQSNLIPYQSEYLNSFREIVRASKYPDKKSK